jgi:hypothetical protein
MLRVERSILEKSETYFEIKSHEMLFYAVIIIVAVIYEC